MRSIVLRAVHKAGGNMRWIGFSVMHVSKYIVDTILSTHLFADAKAACVLAPAHDVEHVAGAHGGCVEARAADDTEAAPHLGVQAARRHGGHGSGGGSGVEKKGEEV